MTTRADGLRRISTVNATIGAVGIASVVGVTVLLAQQGTHNAVATPTVVTNTTQTNPGTSSSAASSSAATTSSSSSDDGAVAPVTATPQATVQQSTSGTVQHAVTSGS